MKKLCFVFLILVAFQKVGYSQFQIGFKGGYNHFSIIDNYDDDQYDKYYYEGTFNPGNSYFISTFFKDYRFKQPVLAFEFAYGSYAFGTNQFHSEPGKKYSMDVNYEIGYLYFIFCPEFVFGQELKFNIKPGIYYGRLVKCLETGTIHDYDWWSGKDKYDTIDHTSDKEFNKYVVGFKAGLGLEYLLNNNLSLIFENNYFFQFGTDSDNWGSSVSIFNISIEIGIAYKFNDIKFPF